MLAIVFIASILIPVCVAVCFCEYLLHKERMAQIERTKK